MNSLIKRLQEVGLKPTFDNSYIIRHEVAGLISFQADGDSLYTYLNGDSFWVKTTGDLEYYLKRFGAV
jgi:hypothetical protein